MEHLEHEIPDLLRDDLPDVERERILRHVAGCPTCRSTLGSIEVLRTTDRKALTDVPEGYFSTLPARILERRARPVRAAWTSTLVAAARPLVPVVAGALVVLALIDAAVTDGRDGAPILVGATDAAEYLSSDPTVSASDLAPVAEALLTDRSLVLFDERPRETGLEDLDPQMTADLVAELNDEEVDRLLSKLSERAL